MPTLRAIELRLLGTLSVRTDAGTEVGAVLAQSKRFALLAYLAAATPRGFHRRDTLVALFWPDADQEHARTSLRKAVHFLRQQLGSEVIVSRGDDEVGLAPDRCWCDAVAFEQALETGRPEHALELYQGDLLPGLHLSALAEFERWLEECRGRLRNRATRAAGKLAEDNATACPAVAARWAGRALELSPYDEEGVRRLVTYMAEAGDRAGAVLAYERFAARLSADLELKPSAHTIALVADLRSGNAAAPASEQAAPAPAWHPAAGARPVEQTAGAVQRERRPTERASISGRGRAAAGVALIALASLAIWYVRSADPRAGNPPPAADLVMIAPFRVSGADPELAYLEEGMLDLLAMQLTGEGGPRAVGADATLAAWHAVGDEGPERRDTALAAARRLGASKVVQGSVVGSTRRIVVTASLRELPTGTRRAEAQVEGPPDSLPGMMDQLTAQLLAGWAGELQRHVALQAPLSAVRLYLDGLRAYREGSYQAAVHHLERALEVDSTFAVAALALDAASVWTRRASDRAGRLAWTYRKKLSGRDLVLLRAMKGPRYPEESSRAELFVARDSATRVLRDRADVWYHYGDVLFHDGRALGLEESWQRAAAAFRRALELDSSFAAPLAHLVEHAQLEGEADAVRRYGARYLAGNSAAEDADYIRWHLAVAARDSAALGQLRRRTPAMSRVSQNRIVERSQEHGESLDLAEEIVGLRLLQASATAERLDAATMAAVLALNRGRPHEASRRLAAVVDDAENRHALLRFRVLATLYWGADSGVSSELGELSAAAEAPPASSPAEREAQILDLCVMEQWRLTRGDTRHARRTVERLRSLAWPADSLGLVRRARLCGDLLDAWLAVQERRPDALVALVRVDSLVQTLPVPPGDDRWMNLAVMRLFERQGDLGRALRAAGRTTYGLEWPEYLSTYLREQGRLADLTGDAPLAVRAYTGYLALRRNPEPSVGPEVEQVRHRLAKLDEQSQLGTVTATPSIP